MDRLTNDMRLAHLVLDRLIDEPALHDVVVGGGLGRESYPDLVKYIIANYNAYVEPPYPIFSICRQNDDLWRRHGKKRGQRVK